jgi:hypothetical protein
MSESQIYTLHMHIHMHTHTHIHNTCIQTDIKPVGENLDMIHESNFHSTLPAAHSGYDDEVQYVCVMVYTYACSYVYVCVPMYFMTKHTCIHNFIHRRTIHTYTCIQRYTLTYKGRRRPPSCHNIHTYIHNLIHRRTIHACTCMLTYTFTYIGQQSLQSYQELDT